MINKIGLFKATVLAVIFTACNVPDTQTRQGQADTECVCEPVPVEPDISSRMGIMTTGTDTGVDTGADTECVCEPVPVEPDISSRIG